jgi:hypothetical protein
MKALGTTVRHCGSTKWRFSDGRQPLRNLKDSARYRYGHLPLIVRLFELRHAPEGIGSAPTRLPKHGRAEHSVADRVAPTSPRRCAWRIPSQCAKPPSPSCHLRPSSFVDPAEQFSSINFSCSEPSSSSVLTQSGTGTVRTWPPLPTRSTMAQCSSRLLEVIQSQRHGFMPSQAAREQQC